MNRVEIKQELIREEASVKRYRERMSKLHDMKCKPSMEQLAESYRTLVVKLNASNRKSAERTFAESQVFNAINLASNLKFHRSFWIVNRNVDLFCPGVGQLHAPIRKGYKIEREPIMRGLAIEVDGPIHDSELKMRKDTSKSDFLHTLGIGHIAIENADVKSRVVQNTIQQLKNLPRLDTRARVRLLRKIYTATIAFHADDSVMAQLFGAESPTGLATKECSDV